jgi:mannose-6-phosphate isomerase
MNVNPKLLSMLPNRVRRNYRGGAGIDRLRSSEGAAVNVVFQDGDHPEEWVASLVEAKNPGLDFIKNEGLSRCDLPGEPLLVDILKSTPDFYLGARYADYGLDLGFLLKILDSSMRLHVQAHPTADFARKHLGSKYGKFECYYILAIRGGTDAYIRLGFQHLPSRAEWRRIISEQDIKAMDSCFEKIPVNVGEVWYIPGAVAHAIGENILMLEIMEPSDLVVRCEFEREGIIVPPEARFMGHDLDFCLNIFDYTELSVDKIKEKYRLAPQPLTACGDVIYEELAAPPISPFTVRRLRFTMKAQITIAGKIPQVAIVCYGAVTINTGNESVVLANGESLFIAAAADTLTVSSHGKAEICLVSPAN